MVFPRAAWAFFDDAPDYELLGAYEILGDPEASPAAKRASREVLERVKHPAHRAPEPLTEPASGRLNDRPRAVLPGPAGGVLIRPGESAECVMSPQRPMRGPFWLGLTCAESLIVALVSFGNQCAFDAPGSVPGAFFDVARPEHLIAMAGCVLGPGQLVRVVLRNVTGASVLTYLTLWGNDEGSLMQRLPPVPPRLEPSDEAAVSAANLAGVQRLELESERAPHGAVLVESASLPGGKREWLERQSGDADATRAHVERASVGYEWGDVWESPSDES